MELKEELIKQIQHHNADQRHAAVQQLDTIQDSWAEPYLISSLGDIDWRIRKAAVESLVRRAKVELVEHILPALRDEENVGRRNAALDVLIQLGDPVVDYVLGLLPEDDRDVRKFIVDILGLIGTSRTVEPLMGFIADSDENVRASAIEYLGKIGDFRALGVMIDLLAERNFWLTFTIVTALGDIENPLAVPYLVPLLEDETLITSVITALGRMSDVSAVPHLLSLLDHEKENVRKFSLRALVSLGLRAEQAWYASEMERRVVKDSFFDQRTPEREQFVLSCCDSTDVSLRRDALVALGWMQSMKAKELFRDALADENYQEAAKSGFLALGVSMVPFLIDNIENEDERIRISIASILGYLGDLRAERSLIKRLTDEIGHVRAAAARALGKLRSIRAIPSLVKLLSDDFPDVRENAMSALVEINGQTIIHDITPLLEDTDKVTREAAVRVFCMLSGPERLNDMLFMLKSESPAIRKTIIERLRQLPQKHVLEPLLFCLTDEHPDVRVAAAKALAGFDDPRIFEALSKAAADRNVWVVNAMISAIGELSDPRKVDLLREKLADERTMIRITALKALTSHAGPELFDEIMSILKDRTADLELRRLAARVLAIIGDERAVPELLRHIDHKDWNFRLSVIESLGHFSGPEIAATLLHIAESVNEVTLVRQAAINSLEKSLSDEVIRHLVLMLQDRTRKIAETAYSLCSRHLDAAIDIIKSEADRPHNRFNWLLQRLLTTCETH